MVESQQKKYTVNDFEKQLEEFSNPKFSKKSYSKTKA